MRLGRRFRRPDPTVGRRGRVRPKPKCVSVSFEVIHGGIGWRWQSCASGGRDLRRTEIAIARLEEGVEGASPFPISEM